MQQAKNLPSCLPKSLASLNEVSIYSGELTQRAVVECIAIVKKAFPTLPLGFYDVLIDRIQEQGFNDARLRDAIMHVVDTCIYPTPTIASFISFDVRFKCYTYDEIAQLVHEGKAKAAGIDYRAVLLPDRPRPVWVHVTDIEKFNLTTVNK